MGGSAQSKRARVRHGLNITVAAVRGFRVGFDIGGRRLCGDGWDFGVCGDAGAARNDTGWRDGLQLSFRAAGVWVKTCELKAGIVWMMQVETRADPESRVM